MSSEDFLTDPDPSSGTDQSPPAEAEALEFGMGFSEPDTVAGDTGEEEGQTVEESVEAGPESATNETESLSPAEQEQGYMRRDDYTRKTQDLAEQRRRLEDDFAAQRRRMEDDFQARLQQMQAQPQPNAQEQQSGSDFHQRISQIAQDPNLSPADRQGLMAFTEMANTIQGYEQRSSEQGQRIEQLERYISEQLGPQVQQAYTSAQTISQEREAATSAELKKEVDEAKSVFGEDLTTQHAEFVIRNHGKLIDPQTQRPMSVASLVAMASGRQAEAAQQAKVAQQAGRLAAKRTTSPNGASNAPPANGGTLTHSQALAEIEATL